MSYGESRWYKTEAAAETAGEAAGVRNVMYLGHGVEIEDDAVRFRRRRLEFEGDAARPGGRRGPWLRRLRETAQRARVGDQQAARC
jgi:hypothetical protein